MPQTGNIDRLKEETHAARWGLLRGYSVDATKWVDFVVTDSTRRESCHFTRLERIVSHVKGNYGGMIEGESGLYRAQAGRCFEHPASGLSPLQAAD